MTDEDKKIVADYMNWKVSDDNIYFAITDNGRNVYYNLNDASLVVQEMQKRGEWEYFVGDIEDTLIYTRYHKEHHSYKSFLTAWLFNSENFFKAFVEWRKGNETQR